MCEEMKCNVKNCKKEIKRKNYTIPYCPCRQAKRETFCNETIQSYCVRITEYGPNPDDENKCDPFERITNCTKTGIDNFYFKNEKYRKGSQKGSLNF